MNTNVVNIIKRIKRSSDSKTLVENMGYLTILQVASYLFPFITLPYLSRVIGVDGFGKIAFASSIILWIKTFVDWGFNYISTRDIAQNRENKDKVSRIFSDVLWARLGLMLISLIILLLLILLIPSFKENSDIILVTFLLIPGHIFFPDWFFQAMERMKYISILNVMSKLMFTILVFVFIEERDDYIVQPLLLSLGYLVAGCISFYFIVYRWQIHIYKPSIRSIKDVTQKSFDVFLNNLMPNLYNNLSTIFLGLFSGSTSVGFLDAGGKPMTIANSFMQLVSRVFFPFLSRKPNYFRYYSRLYLSMAVMVCLIIIVTAPLFIRFFLTEEFAESENIIRLMSLSLIFLALDDIYGTNFLIIHGYTRQLRIITTTVSIFGLVVSSPLIYLYDYWGAAFTILGCRALLGISVMSYAKKRINQNVKD